MPESCIVCRSKDGITFSVPKDENMLNAWMTALQLSKHPRVGSRVCFRHFKYEDIYKPANSKKHKLVKGAIPNLMDNYSEKFQYITAESGRENTENYSLNNDHIKSDLSQNSTLEPVCDNKEFAS